MQRQIGVDDPDERDVREMQTFRDHLRADKNVDLAGAKASQRFAIRILARHRIGIHPPNDCLRENLRDVGLHFFRAETGIDERVFAARRTFLRNGRGVAAQMAAQARNPAMKGERDAAIRAIARFAAIAAEQRSGKTAPVEKENGLLAFFESSGDRVAQFLRQNGRRFFFASLLPQIDDANERHLVFIDAFGQRRELILAARGVEITFQRWRSGAEKNDALFDLAAHDRDIARVITRRFFLFVGSFVFFIDHDEAEIFERREDGAARSDHDPRASGMNLVPFIVPLAFRQMAVQDRDAVLDFGETALETLDRLRRQRNFRHEHDRSFSSRQRNLIACR